MRVTGSAMTDGWTSLSIGAPVASTASTPETGTGTATTSVRDDPSGLKRTACTLRFCRRPAVAGQTLTLASTQAEAPSAGRPASLAAAAAAAGATRAEALAIMLA